MLDLWKRRVQAQGVTEMVLLGSEAVVLGDPKRADLGLGDALLTALQTLVHLGWPYHLQASHAALLRPRDLLVLGADLDRHVRPRRGVVRILRGRHGCVLDVPVRSLHGPIAVRSAICRALLGLLRLRGILGCGIALDGGIGGPIGAGHICLDSGIGGPNGVGDSCLLAHDDDLGRTGRCVLERRHDHLRARRLAACKGIDDHLRSLAGSPTSRRGIDDHLHLRRAVRSAVGAGGAVGAIEKGTADLRAVQAQPI
mmetsp:Transcript_113509/g.301630  ORF Transcript_113509/g.301630 Transcript_113509/m.301630 type:complete len:255 (-) Transcript_113509:322-1086(-)